MKECPTSQVESPTKVHVFKEHEVALIETAKRIKNLSADKHRRARAKEHFLAWGLLLGDLVAREWAIAHPVPGHSRALVVDVGALPVQHCAGHSAHLG